MPLLANLALSSITGQLEPPEWEAEGAKSRDFTDDLRPDEVEPGMLCKLGTLAWSTFGPLPPKGIRHKNMPAYVLCGNEVGDNHGTGRGRWHGRVRWCRCTMSTITGEGRCQQR